MALGAFVTGDKEIDRKLKVLPRVLQAKVIRSAMRLGMKEVAERARAEAPVLTGTMRDRIKVKAPRKKKRGSVGVDVRVDASDQLVKHTRAGKRVFYPMAVEMGHGSVQPDPFMHRAYAEEGDRANRIAMGAIRVGVEREASRR